MFDKELLDLPRVKRTIALLVCFSFAEAACIVGQALGLSHALVGLWEGGAFTTALLWLTVFSCSFIGVRIVLDLREAFISAYALRTSSTLREELFEATFRTGAPAIQRFGTGTTASLSLDGIDKVKSYLELVLPKFVNMVVLPIVFAIAIFCADWVSGVVVVILLPSMILLMMLIGKTTADRGRAQHASFKVMSNHFIDSVRGISTLSTFEVSRSYAARVFTVSERFREATMRTLKTATLSGSVLDLFATLAIAAVSIMLGLRLIDGSLALLPALFELILTPEYFRPIREFASDYHASLDGVNSLRSVRSMIEAGRALPERAAIPTWNETSCLAVHEVAKSYEGRAALEDVGFSLTAGQHLGIIGESGSGKSTLLRMLAGLEDPSVGRFVLNDSLDLLSLRHAGWQDQLAYIPQDPYVFAGTLRENLTFYNPQASNDQIDQALRLLELGDLVAHLPRGIDTLIGEGGRGLSGGQAQRIALARVLLDEKRKIVLFDEPTAHLDIETEYELKRAILELMKDRTVVFATHRLHWLDSFDSVLVLEDGRVVEAGSVEQLEASGTRFKMLVRALRGGDVA